MKKAIISLGIIGAVAAVVIGGTIAYFNDTEVSTGNIMVAGDLDLKVDHLKQTYNGVDCKTCTVEVVSDNSNMVTGTVGGDDPVAFSHPAETVSNPHNAWTASIPGAEWIWATDPTTDHDAENEVIYTFKKTFEWYGPIEDAVLDLGIASDNSYEIYLNGDYVAGDNTEQNYNAAGQDSYFGVIISNKIHQGVNVLEIKVKNWAPNGWQGTPQTNPGGLLYKLTIDGNCEDDYFKTHCMLWGEKNLGENDRFFDFEDIKPGDSGTNLISLHVQTNDGWACLYINDKEDDDNGLTEPEETAGDNTPGDGEGELSKYIDIFIWKDDGDGMYSGSEDVLYQGSLADDVTSVTIADAGTVTPLSGGEIEYIGLAWCAGTLSFDQEFICDGHGMNDQAQTDSLTASLEIYAEQWRNNSDFYCSDILE